MGYSKKRKKKEKDGMPKKHDPKKNWTHESPRKKEREIYNNIAMSSCYPNKGERDS